MRALAILVRMVDRISLLAGAAMIVLMPAMVVVIAFEVVARYFFSSPTIWAYDVALLCYAWLGMVGGAMALKRNSHIRVDILSSRLSRRGQAVLELVAFPVMAFFLLLIVWQVGAIGLESWHTGSRRPTEWAPPLILFLAAAPVGAVLVLLQLAANTVRAAFVAAGREFEA